MTASPGQSPVPLALPLMMSSVAPSKSAPSQPPKAPAPASDDSEDDEALEPTRSSKTFRHSSFKLPPLRMHLDDLNHTATESFVTLTNPTKVLPNAIYATLTHLYPESGNFPVPATRSVTMILRSTMGGVAYTTGLDLDDAHKEIHVSLSYIKNCCGENDDARRRAEIIGVITHEMVHCYQYNGLGTAPGGLIEGIADFVRLKAGLSPPHWSRKEKSEKWDQGYQHTAYFLEWIEEKFGEGSVARINLALKGTKYKERRFWGRLFGSSVKELWGEFDALRDERMKEKELAKEGAEEVDGGETESRSSPTDARATDAPKVIQAENQLREVEEDGGKASDEEEMVVVEKDESERIARISKLLPV